MSLGFANGCFDLFHVGHLHYLQFAAEMCDTLMVAINSDKSVRRLKGKHRPVISQHHRLEIIEALRIVVFAILFDEPTPINVIKRFRPDAVAVGPGHDPYSPLYDYVRSYGGEVFVMEQEFKAPRTTEILKKCRRS